jgi:hypothetical protein
MALNMDGWGLVDDTNDYPSTLIVGASDVSSLTGNPYPDIPASFSNVGQYTVDLFAPGVNVWSTWGGNVYPYASGQASTGGGSGTNGYEWLSGASQAAPQVSGLAALIQAKYPWETPAEVADRIRFSVDSVSSLATKCWTGGRLNANNALNGTRPNLSGISTRCALTAGGTNPSATEHFSIRGGPAGSTKKIVIMANGPSLDNPPYNLTGIGQPNLTFYNGSGTEIAAMTYSGYNFVPYGGSSFKQQQSALLSSYGLSADCAILCNGGTGSNDNYAALPTGGYYAVLTNGTGSTGIGLVSVYSLDTLTETRLSSLSTQSYCGTQSNAQIAGIWINGTLPRNVFIHAWGASQTNTSNPVSGTAFTLYNSSGTALGNSTVWSSSPAALQQRVTLANGLFTTPGAGSDGVLTVSGMLQPLTLAPGGYTVVVSGQGNTPTGTSTIEVDEF